MFFHLPERAQNAANLLTKAMQTSIMCMTRIINQKEMFSFHFSTGHPSVVQPMVRCMRSDAPLREML